LAKELLSLEWDEGREKVDHSPHGSKDLADALAGVVYGISRRRDVWDQHRIDPDKVAPTFVKYFSQIKDGGTT
jgi:hypothetical protein